MAAKRKIVPERRYWKKDIYLLWLSYLQQSDYMSPRVAEIYREWGDIEGLNTKKAVATWWGERWKLLFAEPEEKHVKVITAKNQISHLKNESYLYLEIPLNMKIKRIDAALKSVIREQRNKIDTLSFEAKFQISSKKPKLESMQDYLKTYILRSTTDLTFKEIAKKREYKTYDPQSAIRRCQMDVQKAKKIIKNVESGIFPGTYS